MRIRYIGRGAAASRIVIAGKVGCYGAGILETDIEDGVEGGAGGRTRLYGGRA